MVLPAIACEAPEMGGYLPLSMRCRGIQEAVTVWVETLDLIDTR